MDALGVDKPLPREWEQELEDWEQKLLFAASFALLEPELYLKTSVHISSGSHLALGLYARDFTPQTSSADN